MEKIKVISMGGTKKIIDQERTNNNERFSFYKSENGKVTYKIVKDIEAIFTREKYSKLFEYLDSQEEKLTDNLKFDVEIDYVTLESLLEYYRRNGDFESIDKELGTNIFNLLTDISQGYYFYPVDIADNFLNDNTLKKLNIFYSENEKFALYCHKNEYSSLIIFELKNKKRDIKYILRNIYNYIDDEDNVKREIAQKIIAEYENLSYKNISDKSKEEIYYKMAKINKDIDKIMKNPNEVNSNGDIIETCYDIILKD